MSEPVSEGSKSLKRPRGLLASRKNAIANEGSGSSTKKPRADDPQLEVDQDTLNAQDWSDLKDLFHEAVDVFYGESPLNALPLIRGVLHECARLSSVHEDPTTIYSPLESSDHASLPDPACAFYNVYTFSWYIMYTFARTDPSVLTEDEPKEPIAYILSALAACEKGRRALDVRKLGKTWDFEFLQARTFLVAAQSWVSLDGHENNDPPTTQSRPVSTPNIIQLAGSSPFAALQRGIDHLSYALDHRPDDSKYGHSYKDEKHIFARSLLDAAQVVLAVTEHLDQDSKDEDEEERQLKNKRLFSARKFFSEVVSQPNISTSIRAQGIFGEGQVELAIGAGIAEVLEGEDNEESDDKEDLRKEATNSLKSAIEKFNEVRRLSPDMEDKSRIEEEDVKPLLQEALVTLATLLPEGPEQEAMYARYREEGGVLEDDDDEEDGGDK
ncbi:hypothetical protein FRC12_005816 [Ceratobasidium sp. 428]|nr:hypothetical protein FRC12_005816 [Ceratobasidium sp. 428]